MRQQTNWVRVIRKIRKQRSHIGELTQHDVAIRVGASQSAISDLERGVSFRPNYDLSVALLDLLDRRDSENRNAIRSEKRKTER